MHNPTLQSLHWNRVSIRILCLLQTTHFRRPFCRIPVGLVYFDGKCLETSRKRLSLDAVWPPDLLLHVFSFGYFSRISRIRHK